MRSVNRIVLGFKPSLSTIDTVELQNPIHPLPEVDIPHGHHMSEPLPPPTILFPFIQTVQYPLLDVSCTSDQGDPRRLIQGLQSPDNGQQVESLTPHIRFSVSGLDFGGSIERSKYKPPASQTLIPARFGLQQVMWCWMIHRGFQGDTMGNIRKAAQTAKLIRLVEASCVVLLADSDYLGAKHYLIDSAFFVVTLYTVSTVYHQRLMPKLSGWWHRRFGYSVFAVRTLRGTGGENRDQSADFLICRIGFPLQKAGRHPGIDSSNASVNVAVPARHLWPLTQFMAVIAHAAATAPGRQVRELDVCDTTVA